MNENRHWRVLTLSQAGRDLKVEVDHFENICTSILEIVQCWIVDDAPVENEAKEIVGCVISTLVYTGLTIAGVGAIGSPIVMEGGLISEVVSSAPSKFTNQCDEAVTHGTGEARVAVVGIVNEKRVFILDIER